MIFLLGLAAFTIGLLFFLPPVFNNTFGHDAAAALSGLDQARKGHNIFYKVSSRSAPGNYLPAWLTLIFWDKYNTRAFYAIYAVYNALACLALFLLMHQLAGAVAAFGSTILFAYYYSHPRMDGYFGVTEQLTALPMLLALYLLLFPAGSESVWTVLAAGLAFSYAVLVKQTMAAYFPGFILMLFGLGHSWPQAGMFTLGCVLVQAAPAVYYGLKHQAMAEYITCIWLFFLPSVFNPKKYNQYYPGHVVRGSDKAKKRWELILKYLQTSPPLLFLGLIGLVVTVAREQNLFQAGLVYCLLLSGTMIFMRGTYFGRYLLNIIPWLAIYAGYGLGDMIAETSGPTALALSGYTALVLLSVKAVWDDRKYFVFSTDPYAFIREVHGQSVVDNYLKWKKIGEYIRDNTKEDDQVLITGWAPHILLYSDRLALPPEACWYTRDYLEMYSQPSYSALGALEKMFGPRWWLKKQPNPLEKWTPEVILFSEGQPDAAGFENLTGIMYTHDPAVQGMSLYRANRELVELLAPFENKGAKIPATVDTQAVNNDVQDVIADLNQQQWTTAYEKLKAIIKRNPEDCRHTLVLGDCMLRLDQPSLFFDFFTRLIKKGYFAGAPQSLIFTKLGEGLFHYGNVTEAEHTFRQALQMDPQNARARQCLDSLHRQASARQARAA